MGWKGPINFKVTPEEVYPSSVFSCSWVNVLSPFAKLWGSAELSQFSDLKESCPKHVLLGYHVLCLATSIKVSPHPTAPRFAAGNPCCFGCGCLAAPLMPVPKLKQSLPLVPGLCCCLAEQPQLCVQPQGKQDQGMGSADGRDAPNSHPGLLAGAGHWQDGAAWRQSWFNPAEGGTAGCAGTAHSSTLTSDCKAFSPGVH